MPKPNKFKAKLTDGKFEFLHKDLFRQHLAKIGNDVDIVLSVEKFRKPRSNNQNAYYFGVVIDILANELGYTPNEMHEALKIKFLTDNTGKLPKVTSTSDLNTQEFEEYLSKVRTFASIELGVYIPSPNENIY